jgi:hypothetical protein
LKLTSSDGCVRKVSTAVGSFQASATSITDVATGELTVFSDRPVEVTSVRSVLQTIGYEVA